MSHNELDFAKWCDYRTQVRQIVLGNRGGDGGFNLYFEFCEANTRWTGLQLSWDQAMGLLEILQAGIEAYYEDNRTEEGGVYKYPTDEDIGKEAQALTEEELKRVCQLIRDVSARYKPDEDFVFVMDQVRKALKDQRLYRRFWQRMQEECFPRDSGNDNEPSE